LASILILDAEATNDVFRIVPNDTPPLKDPIQTTSMPRVVDLQEPEICSSLA
jgi:hypothetical protein